MSPTLIATAMFTALAALAAPAHASPQDDLAAGVEDANHDKHSAWIIERMVTLKLPDKCWPKLLDKSKRGLGLLASDARSIERYAKAVTGDDWAKIESQGANTPEANRAVVDKMVDAFKPKFHVTLSLEADDCTATGRELWLNYLGSTLGSLVKFPPKSGVAQLTINVRAAAKDVKVEVDKAGSTFTITAPRDVEHGGWSDTIENALKRVSAKG
jgi:hypothetical protein